MDNKYGRGSAKVATAHHDAKNKALAGHEMVCQFCNSDQLVFCPTLNDHYCKECGQYQSDVPMDYSTGRSSDY